MVIITIRQLFVLLLSFLFPMLLLVIVLPLLFLFPPARNSSGPGMKVTDRGLSLSLVLGKAGVCHFHWFWVRRESQRGKEEERKRGIEEERKILGEQQCNCIWLLGDYHSIRSQSH